MLLQRERSSNRRRGNRRHPVFAEGMMEAAAERIIARTREAWGLAETGTEDV
jgi:hypothetical protein